MSQFLEYLPIAVFVVVYWTVDIYWATAALMAAVVAQVAVMRIVGVPISTLLKFTLGMALVFGTLTLVLHDERFIKAKPTVVVWVMAAGLLIGRYVLRRDFLKSLLGSQLELPPAAWAHLNIGWSAVLFVEGAANLWVAHQFSTDVWVTFKLFGMLAMSLLASVATAAYLVWAGHLTELEAPPAEPPGES